MPEKTKIEREPPITSTFTDNAVGKGGEVSPPQRPVEYQQQQQQQRVISDAAIAQQQTPSSL